MPLLAELKNRVLIVAGSAGINREMGENSADWLPALLNLSRPEFVRQIQKQQIEAGADIILTNTAGAVRSVLQRYQAASDCERINAAGVQIARTAAGEKGFVAGHLKTGFRENYTFENVSFEEMAASYAEQIEIFLEQKVDLLVAGPLTDLLELRAAVIAANERRGTVPLIAMAKFVNGCSDDIGMNAELAAAVLGALDVDILGAECWCRTRPRKACLCQFTNHRVAANLVPEDRVQMEAQAKSLILHGADIIFLPEKISSEDTGRFAAAVKGKRLFREQVTFPLRIASAERVVKIGDARPFVKIGERINPTNRAALSHSIRDGKTDQIVADAVAQFEHGAHALDVNVGAPMADEVLMMGKAVTEIQKSIPLPLVFDSSKVQVLEAGLRAFSGKALVNSVNGKEKALAEILPLAKKYGAAIIALTIDETIPETAEQRFAILDKILKACDRYGIRSEDILVDPAALAVATSAGSGPELLRSIRLIKKQYNLPVSLGASNVSFGLPDRKLVHNTFLAQAIAVGLDAAILNPLDDEVHKIIAAASLFAGRDEDCMHYIRMVRAQPR